MTLRVWGILIGAMTLLGMLRVSQATALRVKAYAVGQQQRQLHRLENDTRWLHAQVMTLESPDRLVSVMTERNWNLVARSEVSSSPAVVRLADSRGAGPHE